MMNDLCMVGRDEPRETVKDIIINTTAILSDVRNELEAIERAIYGDKAMCGDKETTAGVTPQTPPMLEMLIRQRDFAERLLKTVAHIREGLW